MTPDEINIAIAETQGWKFREDYKGNKLFAPVWEDQNGGWHSQPPDYYHDLNEIHEVVCGLTGSDVDDYAENLCEILDYDKHDRVWFAFEVINATAPKCCEAYLRTIGKWKEADAQAGH